MKTLLKLASTSLVVLIGSLFLLPAVAKADTNPIVTENTQPGTTGWEITTNTAARGYEVAGYITRPSVLSGSKAPVHVNVKSSESRDYTVEVFRMGWYGGVGARRVFGPTQYTAGSELPEAKQVDNTTGRVEANWPVGFELDTDNYLTGVYLIKLTSSKGKQAFVPLTVRSAQPTDYYLLNAHLTWQGYSSMGGNSLYERKGDFPNLNKKCFLWWCQWSWQDPATGQTRTSGSAPVPPRSAGNEVTFKRPYQVPGRMAFGSGEFLPYEMPLVRWIEEQGFNVSYAADFDLHENGIPEGVKSVVLPGHTEYWTGAMRDKMEEAQARGVGVISFGANQAYWRGRIENSSPEDVGKYVLYKSATATGEPSNDDPLKNDPALATAQFRSKFVNKPEQLLLGSMFTGWIHSYIPSPSLPRIGVGLGWVNTTGPTDVSNPLFQNTGIIPNEQFTALTGGEIDKVFTEYPSIPGTTKLMTTKVAPNQWNGGGSSMQVWLCSINWPNSCYYGYHDVVTAEKVAPDQVTKARVVNTGSFSWSYGLQNFKLDNTEYNYSNDKIRQLTRNLMLWSAKLDQQSL